MPQPQIHRRCHLQRNTSAAISKGSLSIDFCRVTNVTYDPVAFTGDIVTWLYDVRGVAYSAKTTHNEQHYVFPRPNYSRLFDVEFGCVYAEIIRFVLLLSGHDRFITAARDVPAYSSWSRRYFHPHRNSTPYRYRRWSHRLSSIAGGQRQVRIAPFPLSVTKWIFSNNFGMNQLGMFWFISLERRIHCECFDQLGTFKKEMKQENNLWKLLLLNNFKKRAGFSQ